MRTLRRPWHTWCGYIKVDLKEMGLGEWELSSIDMAQNKDHCWAFVMWSLVLTVLFHAENFLPFDTLLTPQEDCVPWS
jgi:hypothetical protein